MHILIPITRDGSVLAPGVILDGVTPLMATPRARGQIIVEMKELGAMCKACHVIARSDELTDGLCSAGVGCDGDVDRDMIRDTDLERRHDALEKLSSDVINSFIKTPRNIPPPAKEGEPW
jgi:hypothetical protein